MPAKLGATLPDMLQAAPSATVMEKQHFSVFDDRVIRDHLAAVDRPQLIMLGIEAHVCVLASVDDAIRRGYQVTVVDDGIDSRQAAHAASSRLTMRSLGANVVPAESIVLRWQRIASGDTFRAISKLIK